MADELKERKEFIFKQYKEIKGKKIIKEYEKQIEDNDKMSAIYFEEILKLEVKRFNLEQANFNYKKKIEEIHNETYDYSICAIDFGFFL